MTDELEQRRKQKQAEQETQAQEDKTAILEEAMRRSENLVREGFAKASRAAQVGMCTPEQIPMFAMLHICSAQWLANRHLTVRLNELEERLTKLEGSQPRVTL